MSENIVVAVHGFLGQASDWSLVKQGIQGKAEFKAINLFSDDSFEITELEDYAEELSEEVDEIVAGKKKKIFLGYSLGGRLGLHLLQNKPDQFDHYIFLSTHPGLTESESADRNKRLISDMKWASLISENNWDQFVKDWNQQSVFAGSKEEIQRHASDYDLNKLKRAIVMWTLAQQEDFRHVIQEFQNKMTWVVGEKDLKYLQIAEELKQKEILLDIKRISSGHRIWLDHPNAIIDLLSSQWH